VKIREIFNFVMFIFPEKFNKYSFIPSPMLEKKNNATSSSLLLVEVVNSSVHANNKPVENRLRMIKVIHFSLSNSSEKLSPFEKIIVGSTKNNLERITVVGIKIKRPEK